VALQSIRYQSLSVRASPPRRILSWTALVVQSDSFAAYRGNGFAIPLRRWPFPRPWGFPRANAGRLRVNASTPHLSSTSVVLQSISRPILAALAAQGGHTAPLLGFASLQHVLAARVHFTRAVPRPATVRLQGLVTLLTVFSPCRLAGLVSSRQRSWDLSLRSVPLSQGGECVSANVEPACR
jgi:hypothetical protein